MKILTLILTASVLFTTQAQASSAVYECLPFKDAREDAKDYELPASFTITIRGSKADPVFEITVNGKTATLKEDPWTRKTINSDKFDRYSAKGAVTGVLLAKNAAELPTHFTAKLDFEPDSYHGVHGWFGYNCR